MYDSLCALTRYWVKSVGVFGDAYSINNAVQVSRTRQAPAPPWSKPDPPFEVRHVLGSTLITNSVGDNKTAARPIERIAVLGAGTMGHGIAQVAAAAGYEVVLRDIDEDAVTRGRQAIERNLAKGVQLGRVTEQDRDQTLARIRTTTQLQDIAKADLIIEAAPEKLELKQNLLRESESLTNPNCIFASNTSSLSI